MKKEKKLKKFLSVETMGPWARRGTVLKSFVTAENFANNLLCNPLAQLQEKEKTTWHSLFQ